MSIPRREHSEQGRMELDCAASRGWMEHGPKSYGSCQLQPRGQDHPHLSGAGGKGMLLASAGAFLLPRLQVLSSSQLHIGCREQQRTVCSCSPSCLPSHAGLWPALSSLQPHQEIWAGIRARTVRSLPGDEVQASSLVPAVHSLPCAFSSIPCARS